MPASKPPRTDFSELLKRLAKICAALLNGRVGRTVVDRRLPHTLLRPARQIIQIKHRFHDVRGTLDRTDNALIAVGWQSARKHWGVPDHNADNQPIGLDDVTGIVQQGDRDTVRRGGSNVHQQTSGESGGNSIGHFDTCL